MEKIALIIEEIKNEQKKVIVEKTSSIVNEIMFLLTNIKSSNNVEEANKYFDTLQNIQNILAVTFFKDELYLGDALWKFVKDFDRADDMRTRTYLFNKIKKDEYALS